MRANEITIHDIRRNLAPSTLYEEAIRYDTGALIALSGEKTGRLTT